MSVVLLALTSTVMLQGQAPEAQDYASKAEFLANIAKFTDWSPSAFASESSPIDICIYGEATFVDELERTVAAEPVNGRRVVVNRLPRSEDMKNCHIAFFSSSENKNISKRLRELKGTNVLTIGEDPDFLNQGGMIRFVENRDRIEIEVNLTALEGSPVKLSSKLLRVAKTLRPG